MARKSKISTEDTIKKEEYLYIPDIPQDFILDTTKSRDEEEIEFLEKILEIQHSGGWGHHLDDFIYNRIKVLQNE